MKTNFLIFIQVICEVIEKVSCGASYGRYQKGFFLKWWMSRGQSLSRNMGGGGGGWKIHVVVHLHFTRKENVFFFCQFAFGYQISIKSDMNFFFSNITWFPLGKTMVTTKRITCLMTSYKDIRLVFRRTSSWILKHFLWNRWPMLGR